MAEDRNPYAAPRAEVRDVEEPDLGDFIPAGRGVSAGRGWAWLQEGWGYFMRSPGTWIGLALTFMVVFFVMAIIPFVGGLASNLLFPVFLAGIMAGCKALEDGDGLRVGHLFAGFSMNAGQLVLVGLLYLLAIIAVVVIAFLAAGGPSLFARLQGGDMGAGSFMSMALFFLVMMALLVPVIMMIWFAPSLSGLNNMNATQSMASSFKGCLKNIIPFLVYGLVLLVVGAIVIGLLAAVVGGSIAGMMQGTVGYGAVILAVLLYLALALVAMPITMGSIYAAYRDIYYEGVR